jgi:hypothetical protein
LLWEKFGATPGDRLGRSVRLGGDSDSDGLSDIIVGTYDIDCNGSNAGMAFLLRGLDGVELHSACGVADAYFASRVAGNLDVDQDGLGDFLVGAFDDDRGAIGGGAYAIYSGSDGTLLREEFGAVYAEGLGWAVASLPDLDGDLVRDYAVSSPGDAATAHVTVFSGISGQVLLTLTSSPSDRGFGAALADAGDVNADGVTDILVGNSGGEGVTIQDSGQAWVFSGADGSVLFGYEGEQSYASFGADVDGTGDLNGDGHADFIVGSPRFENLAANSRGRVYVYSGADGSLLYHHDGRYLGLLGIAVSGAGDVNRDGVPDYLAYDPTSSIGVCDNGGALHVYSGRNGLRLYHFDGGQVFMGYSDSIDGGADVNGDGDLEVAVGSPSDDQNGMDSGTVTVFSLKSFYCDAEPKVECEGYNVAIRMAETDPGKLIGLAVVGIDGTPLFSFIAIAPADSLGRFAVLGTIPTGLGGHFVDFQSFAVGFSGKLVASAVERVTFR